ncbi:hypothetical protein EFR00_28720 [Rhizobium sophoriradicis]|uniref:hypothetical protein n=1 Tax=Rhizobium sophoriradicis TaxID=1535245 RepID=UPI00098F7E46|nr:hypothetical protein [Rhizobium sophoriradicis]RSB86941.1 hypothetical protein EFR00_28720 [Rhizobium sophoriradicis]
MTPIILLAVTLSVAMCVLAFALATHALPFMLGLAAFRLAHACGAGVIVAGIVAIVAATLSFALFVYLWEVLRNQTARLVVAVVYAVPAAVAGYALMHGAVGAASVSEPTRQFFCLACGAVVGFSAAARLARLR